jgi:hypothetical protein
MMMDLSALQVLEVRCSIKLLLKCEELKGNLGSEDTLL